ncbi:MAG: hypothetical protein CMG74_00915 [Candidatus Marinimicrobia bacterium]|nr:hypothetical protein [Candidatus Neomarinimicrobiota bacterium]
MIHRIIFFIFCFIYAESRDALLTIYKDGTALIKQPVRWTVTIGKNIIDWDQLPTGIQRDTPFLNLDGATIMSQRFNDKVFSSVDYFAGLKGQKIFLKPVSGKMINGILMEINQNHVSIEYRNSIYTYNRKELEYMSASNKVVNPIFKPYLSWDIQSSMATNLNGELVYKSKNFSWSTVYRIKMVDEVHGELIAEAVIDNSSDLDFTNVAVQLVEGNLNKLYSKRLRKKRAVVSQSRMAPEKMMEQEELGDYHIYPLKNSHNLQAKESITVRMYGPLNVKYKKTYVFENSERRQKEEPLEVKILLKNTESNGLGIPLPDGKIELYTYSSIGGLEYIGADKMGQVPKGQSTEITSGRAFDIVGNRKVLNYDRQRKSEEAVIEIKVTNARSEIVDILLIEHINGDWIIKDESLDYLKKDASTIHFPLVLNAGETKSVYYTYRKEWK